VIYGALLSESLDKSEPGKEVAIPTAAVEKILTE